MAEQLLWIKNGEKSKNKKIFLVSELET